MQIVIDVKNQEIADKIIWFLKQIKGISFRKKNVEYDYDIIKSIKEEEKLPLEKCKKWEELLNEL